MRHPRRQRNEQDDFSEEESEDHEDQAEREYIKKAFGLDDDHFKSSESEQSMTEEKIFDD